MEKWGSSGFVHTVRCAVRAWIALGSTFVAGAFAGPPLRFEPAPQLSAFVLADGNFGSIAWEVAARKITGGGSTGGGFSSASLWFNAEIAGGESLARIKLSISRTAINDASNGMGFTLNVPILVRTAFRKEDASDLGVQLEHDNIPISGDSGWLEPGMLTLKGGSGAGDWNLDLAADPRLSFYSTDFLDAPLDDGWTVSTSNVSGFGTVNAPYGGSFSVNEIVPLETGESGGPWAEVRFTRPVSGTGDFVARFLNAWCALPLCGSESFHHRRAMQSLEFRLLDASGGIIARSAFYDGWILSQGSVHVGVGNAYVTSGEGSAAGSGQGDFSIARNGADISVSSAWPSLSFSGPQTGSVRDLQIAFAFWPGTYDSGPSTYGFLRANLVSLTGQRDCAEDINRDHLADDEDFQAFAAAYNILECADRSMPLGCPADFNADGFVDDADFLWFVSAYDRLLCP